MRSTQIAQHAVSEVLQPGDLAVDATVGNGHDTLFLCQTVGASGRVLGFDVQAEAIAATRAKLLGAGIESTRFDLHHRGHEHLGEFAQPGTVAAIMFNLGYLPGSDKALITRPETTLAALATALPLLRPGGVLTIVCYPGHEGGDEEAESVKTWSKSLDENWLVQTHPQARPDAPFAVAIRSPITNNK